MRDLASIFVRPSPGRVELERRSDEWEARTRAGEHLSEYSIGAGRDLPCLTWLYLPAREVVCDCGFRAKLPTFEAAVEARRAHISQFRRRAA